MKKAISVFLMLLGLAAIVGGSFYLWGRRQWRVVVEVNGHTMTAGELRARGKGLLESAKRDEHLVVPNNRAKQAEARHYYEAEAARAWVFKVLMLDEATSALDNITQQHVADSLASLKCTRLVIAHRLSTVRDCDRILLIEGGKIAEEGTYEDLMAKNGAFADLVRRQQLDEK